MTVHLDCDCASACASDHSFVGEVVLRFFHFLFHILKLLEHASIHVEISLLLANPRTSLCRKYSWRRALSVFLGESEASRGASLSLERAHRPRPLPRHCLPLQR